MRHLDSRHFPTNDSHAQSFSVFNRFPTDIALVILEFCSPFDLTQLGLASQFLRAFTTAHKHLWIAAHEKLAPAVKSSGNYSMGVCVMVVRWRPWYSKWTESQPSNFVLRFRAYSSTCASLLLTETNFYVDKAKKYDDFFWGKWLPRLKHAESERQQAIRVDSGNSHRDPKGFPRRTGKQLDEVHISSFDNKHSSTIGMEIATRIPACPSQERI
ncbi:hypothetical protein DFH09DRAFT_1374645 [Mycena vulgaris]|nr:hypothetical protein DFH09DRAFT_1374645 [Mycena vulgaris]